MVRWEITACVARTSKSYNLQNSLVIIIHTAYWDLGYACVIRYGSNWTFRSACLLTYRIRILRLFYWILFHSHSLWTDISIWFGCFITFRCLRLNWSWTRKDSVLVIRLFFWCFGHMPNIYIQGSYFHMKFHMCIYAYHEHEWSSDDVPRSPLIHKCSLPLYTSVCSSAGSWYSPSHPVSLHS